MKKIILLIMVLLTCCGCSAVEETTASHPESEIVVKLPTDNSVNGYRISQDKTESQTATGSSALQTAGAAYRANINSQKFHTADCSYGQKINEENLYTSNSREDMISKGYTACQRCKP